VAITATGKSSAATSGKVVAADTSLRIAKPANASLRTAKTTANRSAAKAATTHAAAVEAAASVHPAATATVTATASHRWRSKRKSERERRRSNQFEISHRTLSFSGETEFSPSLGKVLTTFIVPKVVSRYRAPLSNTPPRVA
jgi:hypothetical protein